MRKIKIKNFGPIKAGFEENEGFIDVARVTIFIGNQGSGKSSVAKLISTISWLEKALYRGDLKENYLTSYNRFVNNYCAYQNIKNYFKPETEIEYVGNAYTLKYKNGSLNVMPTQGNGYLVPKIMYVPAERNFVSSVDRPDKLRSLPQPLVTFLAEYEKAQEEVKDGVKLPINDTIFEFDKLNKISQIKGEDFKVRLSEASSGFQSSVPLFLVSRSLAISINKEGSNASVIEMSREEQKRLKNEIEKIISNDKLTDEAKKAALEVISSKFSSACFINIVEELEQNLYPESQRHILNCLLEYVNRSIGNELILTTHSPYIVNYITLAIKGFEVRSLIESCKNIISSKDLFIDKLKDVVPILSCIPATDVAIYELNKQGRIIKLKDFNGIPSDDNFLNQNLSETNAFFDKLLEIQEEVECQ